MLLAVVIEMNNESVVCRRRINHVSVSFREAVKVNLGGAEEFPITKFTALLGS